MMLSQFLLIPFFSPSMVYNVGFAETDLPYIYFFGGGMTIFTSPIVGRMADRFGKARIFTIAAVLLLIPCLIITNLGPTPMWVALLATTMFFVCGNCRFIPAMAMITSTVKPATRGSFMSINSSVQSLASGTASLVGGLIVATGADGKLMHYNRLGYLSVGLSLIAIYLGRKLKPVDAAQPAASSPDLPAKPTI
jgi:MFS transporter, DHA1 family, inner membrane transport protein